MARRPRKMGSWLRLRAVSAIPSYTPGRWVDMAERYPCNVDERDRVAPRESYPSSRAGRSASIWGLRVHPGRRNRGGRSRPFAQRFPADHGEATYARRIRGTPKLLDLRTTHPDGRGARLTRILSLDHVPRADGGPLLGYQNLKPAHRLCNALRHVQKPGAKMLRRRDELLAQLRRKDGINSW